MKSVVITGATSGIGLKTAEKFHQMGYFCFLLARNLENLKTLHQKLANSHPVICDLADYQSIDNAVEQIKSVIKFPLSSLVNNAGIFERREFAKVVMSEWEMMFKVNLHGPAYLTQKMIPLLKKTSNTSICMVSSTLGIKTSTNTSAYSASKAAMINLTQTLALELAPFKIRCNTVAPGIVETPIHGFDQMSPDQKRQTLELYNTLQPLGRVGQAAEIADSIYFLCSEQSSWTTGAILSVDGGINLL